MRQLRKLVSDAMRVASPAIVVMFCVLLAQPASYAQLADTESITSIYSLSAEIAGYDPSRKSVRFFSAQGQTLVERHSFAMPANVMGIVDFQGSYLIATGSGPEDRSAPLRITRFSKDGRDQTVVFETSGERNQLTRLLSRDDKIWIDFFDSKYVTKIGFLSASATIPWSFTEALSIRMGDSLDVHGDSVFIGRSYGDLQGQDGDLILLSNGQRVVLPSYRGVRGVLAFGDHKAPSVVIGDGWHQNYGQLAQGRVSLLSKQAGSGRYALELLDQDQGNYGFSKFIALPSKASARLVALGNASVNLYDLAGAANKNVLHRQRRADRLMDLAMTETPQGQPLLVVSDGGLWLYPLK